MKVTVLLTVLMAYICAIQGYQIGLGRADVTGPSVEITFVSLTFRKHLPKIKKNYAFIWFYS